MIRQLPGCGEVSEEIEYCIAHQHAYEMIKWTANKIAEQLFGDGHLIYEDTDEEW